MSASVIAPGVALSSRERELSQELALAAGEQHLGDARRGENPDVPGAAVGDVGQHLQAEPGQAHLDGGEAEHVLRMRGREAEDRRPADVLPGQVDRPDPELPDEKVQVFSRRRAAVLARLVAGVAEAAQVDGEDAVAGREQRDELPEGPPGLGKPVDQQDRRSAGSRRDVVQPGSVDLRAVVRDPRQRETS